MARVIDLVHDNIEALKALMRHGYVKPTFINDLKVYQFYMGTEKMKYKGERRNFTAEHFGISKRWVEKIVERFEEKA